MVAWREAAERGEIGLGGCQRMPGSPSHQGNDCGNRFVWTEEDNGRAIKELPPIIRLGMRPLGGLL